MISATRPTLPPTAEGLFSPGCTHARPGMASPSGARGRPSAAFQSPSHSLRGDDIALALVEHERVAERSGRLVAAFRELEGVGQSHQGTPADVELVTVLGPF